MGEHRPAEAAEHHRRGVQLREEGKLDEAREAQEAALARGGDWAEIHYEIGIGACGRGQWEEAVGAFGRALDRSPGLPGAHRNLGWSLGQLGREEEAAAAFGEACRLDPADWSAWYGLGVACSSLGRFQQAVEALKHALSLAPGQARLHFHLGAAHARAGDLVSAIDECRSLNEKEERELAAGLSEALKGYRHPSIVFEGGNGSSVQDAVRVEGAPTGSIAIHAEHVWLERYGARGMDWVLLDQALLAWEGKFFDALRVRFANGEESQAFFDVTAYKAEFSHSWSGGRVSEPVLLVIYRTGQASSEPSPDGEAASEGRRLFFNPFIEEPPPQLVGALGEHELAHHAVTLLMNPSELI
jgi:Flp pilus assembly protein TadD